MSCLEKERKPMVPLKQLDIIFRRRYLKNTQFYFTNREHAIKDESQKIKKSKPFRTPQTERLLSFMKYSDRKEKLQAKQMLKLPLHLKDNPKIAATRDISTRLYVPEPPDDVKTVLAIHPEFYTVIEGRPLRAFDDIKVYCTNIRNYVMNRQQIGYRRDLILKIDQFMTDEKKEYEKINENLRYHIKDFQKFLTEDYKKACEKVAQADKVFQDLQTKESEFYTYITRTIILNNVIFKLDAIRNLLKSYRRYLFYVAPFRWRQQYDESLVDKDQKVRFEVGKFANDDLVESLDIDKIISAAKIEFEDPLPASLYFKTPDQMLYLFRTMELQSREYLIQLSKTDGPFRLLQDRIKNLNDSTKVEMDYFQYYIEDINKIIDRETYNEQHLKEKFFRILNETFYNSIVSPDVLKLKICIEYVYEQVFGKCEEGHHTLQDPMKILEVMYEELNLKLDNLDFKIITQARRDIFAQDLKMMKDAYIAQRELRAFKEMTEAMQKAFLPPKKFKRPQITKFVDKKTLRKLERQRRREEATKVEYGLSKTYKVTPEDQENLTFFTEWRDGMNPAPFIEEYNKYVKPIFKDQPISN